MTGDSAPLVTVGIAVFNGGEDLETALRSIAGQDHSNTEVLISDDGSTDGSLEICEKFVRENHGWTLVRNSERLGIAGNYNKLISLASGKYFMLADQDDRREPTFISRCVEVLERDPQATLCHSHTGVVWPGMSGTLYHVNTLDSVDGVRSTVLRYWRFLRQYSDTTIYGLVRTDILRKTRGWKEGLAPANALLFELLLQGHFRQVPDILYLYTAKGLRNRPNPKEEFARTTGGKNLPRLNAPFLTLAIRQSSSIARSAVNPLTKLTLFSLLWTHVVLVNGAKLANRTLGKVWPGSLPKPVRAFLGRCVYPATDIHFVISPDEDDRYYPPGWPLES